VITHIHIDLIFVQAGQLRFAYNLIVFFVKVDIHEQNVFLEKYRSGRDFDFMRSILFIGLHTIRVHFSYSRFALSDISQL
jgi:hypothetical protein